MTRAVLVYSTRPIVRYGLIRVLSSLEARVHETDDGASALNVLRSRRVDAVIIDAERPHRIASELPVHLSAAHRRAPVAVISDHGWHTSWRRAAEAGANIEVLSSDTSISRFSLLLGQPKPLELHAGLGLTRRQIEVLTIAAKGYPTGEIARVLYLSPGTVKRHLHEAFVRLKVRSRLDAINRARTLGLIDPA